LSWWRSERAAALRMPGAAACEREADESDEPARTYKMKIHRPGSWGA